MEEVPYEILVGILTNIDIEELCKIRITSPQLKNSMDTPTSMTILTRKYNLEEKHRCFTSLYREYFNRTHLTDDCEKYHPVHECFLYWMGKKNNKKINEYIVQKKVTLRYVFECMNETRNYEPVSILIQKSSKFEIDLVIQKCKNSGNRDLIDRTLIELSEIYGSGGGHLQKFLGELIYDEMYDTVEDFMSRHRCFIDRQILNDLKYSMNSWEFSNTQNTQDKCYFIKFIEDFDASC